MKTKSWNKKRDGWTSYKLAKVDGQWYVEITDSEGRFERYKTDPPPRKQLEGERHYERSR